MKKYVFISYLEVSAGSTTLTSALPFAGLFGLSTTVEALGLCKEGVIVIHFAQQTVTSTSSLLIGVVATHRARSGRGAVLRAVIA